MAQFTKEVDNGEIVVDLHNGVKPSVFKGHGINLKTSKVSLFIGGEFVTSEYAEDSALESVINSYVNHAGNVAKNGAEGVKKDLSVQVLETLGFKKLKKSKDA